MTAAPNSLVNFVDVNGLRLAYLAENLAARDKPLVILVHGFPDTAYTWKATLPVVAAAGFRVVAPFLRGYAPSAAPADGDYSPVRLGEDVVGLIKALGEERAIVVGHDWGALAAGAAANIAPDVVTKLVTLAVPHSRAISPLALGKARHFIAFQFRARTVARLRANDFAAIDDIYRLWSPGLVMPEADMRVVKDMLASSLENTLAFYWSFPKAALSSSARAVMQKKTSVPALAFFGDDDGALYQAAVEKTRAAFTGPYEIVRMKGVGHFLHLEAPDAFHARLLAFLS